MNQTSSQNNSGKNPGKNSRAIIKTALVLGAVALTVYIVFIYAAVSASG